MTLTFLSCPLGGQELFSQKNRGTHERFFNYPSLTYGNFVPYEARKKPCDTFSTSDIYNKAPVVFSGTKATAYRPYKKSVIQNLMNWARKQARMGHKLYSGQEDINIGAVGVLTGGIKNGITAGIRNKLITAAWNEIFDFSSVCAELRAMGNLSDMIAMYHLANQNTLKLESISISALNPLDPEFVKIAPCEICFESLLSSPRTTPNTLIIHAEKAAEQVQIVAQPLGFIFPLMSTWQPSYTEHPINTHFPVTYSTLAQTEVTRMNPFFQELRTSVPEEARKLMNAAKQAYHLCEEKDLCRSTQLEAGAAGLFLNEKNLAVFSAPAHDKGRRDRFSPEIFVHHQALTKLSGPSQSKLPILYAYFSKQGQFPTPIQIKRLYKDFGCDMNLLVALIQDNGIHITTLADHQRVVYTKRSHVQEKFVPWK